MQPEMMFSELAAIVPGRDLDHTRQAGGGDPGPQGSLDRGTVEAVHDNLQHRIDRLGQLALDAGPPAQCRTVGIVKW